MANDSDAYKSAQRTHADKIKAERAVMDMTGATRSQIRAQQALLGLTRFAQRQTQVEGLKSGGLVTSGLNQKPESSLVQFPPTKIPMEAFGPVSTVPGPLGGTTLPTGAAGDMLYYDGSDWVVLANPGAPAANNWVLRHDGTAPYWDEPEEC